MIRVQREDFDTGAELEALGAGDGAIGGVCAFVGLVRDFSEGSEIRSMTLEHYPGMTERELERIEREANERWALRRTLVIHRFGKFAAGDRIVLVAVAASHRGDAFEACQFLIDWLKTRAPFWKREETGTGGRWVDARDSDAATAGKWVAADKRRE